MLASTTHFQQSIRRVLCAREPALPARPQPKHPFALHFLYSTDCDRFALPTRNLIQSAARLAATRGGIEGPNAQHGRASGPRLRGMTGPWLRARDGVSAGAISVAFVRVASAWEATPWRGFLDSDRSGGHQRTSYVFVYSIYCTGGRWDCGEVREIEALWWWQGGFRPATGIVVGNARPVGV